MTRIVRYILMHDSGVAPCIDNRLLSLATCKPKFRSSSKPGDWVMGFRPRPDERGLVMWAGVVARSIEVGDYECEYRGRLDTVYRATPGGGFKRLNPKYHTDPKDFRKDTSAPVLVFSPDSTWYFGKQPKMLPEHLLHLAAHGRGHRVSGVKEGDAFALRAWLASIAPAGIHSTPHDSFAAKCRRC